MKGVDSYLFLYLIERDFQKLISSSLEEKDGIAFTSMTDRSGGEKRATEEVTDRSITSLNSSEEERRDHKGSEDQRQHRQTTGSRTRSTHNSSHMLCSPKESL